MSTAIPVTHHSPRDISAEGPRDTVHLMLDGVARAHTSPPGARVRPCRERGGPAIRPEDHNDVRLDTDQA
jgi:hypothetical protein